MTKPNRDLDMMSSPFTGRMLTHVPVIRVFGTTPAAQKVCLHIHRCMPYLYIELDQHIHAVDVQRHLTILAASIERALNVTNNVQPVMNANAPSSAAPAKNTASSSSNNNNNNPASTAAPPPQSNYQRQHIFDMYIVRARAFFGYHIDNTNDDTLEGGGGRFIRIVLLEPGSIRRVAKVLQSGAIMGRIFQPFESHIPYLLHFLVDYNLYGMDFIDLSSVTFRRPLPMTTRRGANLSAWRPIVVDKGTTKTTVGGAGAAEPAVAPDTRLWLHQTVPWEMCTTIQLEKNTHCELEVDCIADHIINRLRLVQLPLQTTSDEVKLVHSLASIWDNERERRREKRIEKKSAHEQRTLHAAESMAAAIAAGTTPPPSATISASPLLSQSSLSSQLEAKPSPNARQLQPPSEVAMVYQQTLQRLMQHEHKWLQANAARSTAAPLPPASNVETLPTSTSRPVVASSQPPNGDDDDAMSVMSAASDASIRFDGLVHAIDNPVFLDNPEEQAQSSSQHHQSNIIINSPSPPIGIESKTTISSPLREPSSMMTSSPLIGASSPLQSLSTIMSRLPPPPPLGTLPPLLTTPRPIRPPVPAFNSPATTATQVVPSILMTPDPTPRLQMPSLLSSSTPLLPSLNGTTVIPPSNTRRYPLLSQPEPTRPINVFVLPSSNSTTPIEKINVSAIDDDTETVVDEMLASQALSEINDDNGEMIDPRSELEMELETERALRKRILAASSSTPKKSTTRSHESKSISSLSSITLRVPQQQSSNDAVPSIVDDNYLDDDNGDDEHETKKEEDEILAATQESYQMDHQNDDNDDTSGISEARRPVKGKRTPMTLPQMDGGDDSNEESGSNDDDEDDDDDNGDVSQTTRLACPTPSSQSSNSNKTSKTARKAHERFLLHSILDRCGSGEQLRYLVLTKQPIKGGQAKAWVTEQRLAERPDLLRDFNARYHSTSPLPPTRSTTTTTATTTVPLPASLISSQQSISTADSNSLNNTVNTRYVAAKSKSTSKRLLTPTAGAVSPTPLPPNNDRLITKGAAVITTAVPLPSALKSSVASLARSSKEKKAKGERQSLVTQPQIESSSHSSVTKQSKQRQASSKRSHNHTSTNSESVIELSSSSPISSTMRMSTSKSPKSRHDSSSSSSKHQSRSSKSTKMSSSSSSSKKRLRRPSLSLTEAPSVPGPLRRWDDDIDHPVPSPSPPTTGIASAPNLMKRKVKKIMTQQPKRETTIVPTSRLQESSLAPSLLRSSSITRTQSSSEKPPQQQYEERPLSLARMKDGGNASVRSGAISSTVLTLGSRHDPPPASALPLLAIPGIPIATPPPGAILNGTAQIIMPPPKPKSSHVSGPLQPISSAASYASATATVMVTTTITATVAPKVVVSDPVSVVVPPPVPAQAAAAVVAQRPVPTVRRRVGLSRPRAAIPLVPSSSIQTANIVITTPIPIESSTKLSDPIHINPSIPLPSAPPLRQSAISDRSGIPPHVSSDTKSYASVEHISHPSNGHQRQVGVASQVIPTSVSPSRVNILAKCAILNSPQKGAFSPKSHTTSLSLISDALKLDDDVDNEHHMHEYQDYDDEAKQYYRLTADEIERSNETVYSDEAKGSPIPTVALASIVEQTNKVPTTNSILSPPRPLVAPVPSPRVFNTPLHNDPLVRVPSVMLSLPLSDASGSGASSTSMSPSFINHNNIPNDHESKGSKRIRIETQSSQPFSSALPVVTAQRAITPTDLPALITPPTSDNDDGDTIFETPERVAKVPTSIRPVPFLRLDEPPIHNMNGSTPEQVTDLSDISPEIGMDGNHQTPPLPAKAVNSPSITPDSHADQNLAEPNDDNSTAVFSVLPPTMSPAVSITATVIPSDHSEAIEGESLSPLLHNGDDVGDGDDNNGDENDDEAKEFAPLVVEENVMAIEGEKLLALTQAHMMPLSTVTTQSTVLLSSMISTNATIPDPVTVVPTTEETATSTPTTERLDVVPPPEVSRVASPSKWLEVGDEDGWMNAYDDDTPDDHRIASNDEDTKQRRQSMEAEEQIQNEMDAAVHELDLKTGHDYLDQTLLQHALRREFPPSKVTFWKYHTLKSSPTSTIEMTNPSFPPFDWSKEATTLIPASTLATLPTVDDPSLPIFPEPYHPLPSIPRSKHAPRVFMHQLASQPPSIASLRSSFGTYGLPDVQHTAPYFSNPLHFADHRALAAASIVHTHRRGPGDPPLAPQVAAMNESSNTYAAYFVGGPPNDPRFMPDQPPSYIPNRFAGRLNSVREFVLPSGPSVPEFQPHQVAAPRPPAMEEPLSFRYVLTPVLPPPDPSRIMHELQRQKLKEEIKISSRVKHKGKRTLHLPKEDKETKRNTDNNRPEKESKQAIMVTLNDQPADTDHKRALHGSIPTAVEPPIRDIEDIGGALKPPGITIAPHEEDERDEKKPNEDVVRPASPKYEEKFLSSAYFMASVRQHQQSISGASPSRNNNQPRELPHYLRALEQPLAAPLDDSVIIDELGGSGSGQHAIVITPPTVLPAIWTSPQASCGQAPIGVALSTSPAKVTPRESPIFPTVASTSTLGIIGTSQLTARIVSKSPPKPIKKPHHAVIPLSARQHLTLLSIEVFAPSRNQLRPDPVHDYIAAIAYCVRQEV
jgi:hypothetical protein